MLLNLPLYRSRSFARTFGLVQYTLIFLIFLFPTRTFAQLPNGTHNFTIALDSPQIIFTPFLCNETTSQSTPESCRGGWVPRRDNGQLTVSTTGPDPATGEIIPQMFFQFRASALYLLTSPTSNAQANITVTTNGTTISALFDSSLGSASILNLIQPSITTFALTFVPNDTPQEFTLASVIITIPNTTVVSTIPFLPTMTLPPFSSPPIFTPPPTPTRTTPQPLPPPPPSTQPVSGTSKRSNIALAVGVTIGLGLGLTSAAALGYWWYKKRQPKRWVRSLTTERNSISIGPSMGASASSGAPSRGPSRLAGDTGGTGITGDGGDGTGPVGKSRWRVNFA